MSYFKSVNIKQDIETSANSTSTANIASLATWEGASEETLGVNGIQVYHYADQACTVYVDQGIDEVNWDIIDSFTCLASVAQSRTFTSVAPLF